MSCFRGWLRMNYSSSNFLFFHTNFSLNHCFGFFCLLIHFVISLNHCLCFYRLLSLWSLLFSVFVSFFLTRIVRFISSWLSLNLACFYSIAGLISFHIRFAVVKYILGIDINLREKDRERWIDLDFLYSFYLFLYFGMANLFPVAREEKKKSPVCG